MTDPILQIPLSEIDENALPRDRSHVDAVALDELMRSILTEGLRQPIEVWQLTKPRGPHRYGLIAGYRRLAALRATGVPHATIAAFVRTVTSIPQAMAAMVSENENRADLSPWDRARILVDATSEGIFDTIDAAVRALHPLADPAKQSRLRTLAAVVEEFGTLFSAPHALSQRQMLRLAGAMRADFGDLIRAAFLEHRPRGEAAEWALIEPILSEAEEWQRNPDPMPRPGRPKRLTRPRDRLCVRREWMRDGWCLRFTGEDATSMLMDGLMDEIERWVGQ